ncbi:alpha/beta hydrolase [Pectobacterium polaris]|uniref:alpha/beta hydrolase n=1 Tax=Pectobacterium polaris TaxID=2042057 RepID=UPI0023AE93C1|nr:alpha/beta hydrolase [Pectobacterium polaris]MDE8741009.1 alpha/beta hydrolase [Pectobacterium polaris]
MFIVTNREVKPSASGLKKLGHTPNPKGSNELRLVEANRSNGTWNINILPDVLTAPMKKEIGLENSNRKLHASDYVARIVIERVQKNKKNVLFFVHGYNNDVGDVLDRAERLEKLYNVEVIVFSWPAHGGGIVGVASYLSDKRDARSSAGALDRCIGRMADLFTELTKEQQEEIKNIVDAKFKSGMNLEKRNALLVELQEKKCPFSMNMIVHSMGAYVYEYALIPSSSDAGKLLFDNVLLVAPDTNNLDHEKWVDKIPCRKSLYITINENDKALKFSRAKIGDEQLPRLGHYRHNLVSKQANYIDFTDYTKIGNEHAYFEGDPVEDHASPVYIFFSKILNGESAYDVLSFDNGVGAYRFK